ncbi:MAG: hypothetical protein L7F77_14465 [Candidatus Magnetominusculus sp. LBB02]|nr:hypothetical protein [Candidatus Magnetominusculus sp. LBB02]
MPIQFVLPEELIGCLSTFNTIDIEDVQAIIDKLSNIDVLPILPSGLQKIIEEALPSKSDKAAPVFELLMSLYTMRRQTDMSADDFLESILFSVEKAEKPWSEEDFSKLKDRKSILQNLLSLSAVWNVAKGLDLFYAYDCLLRSAKIMTDIRPIFNENATEIQGSIISYTIRLYLDSIEGRRTLSIALDEKDVKNLLKQCERALRKAETSKSFMQANRIKSTIISGEES